MIERMYLALLLLLPRGLRARHGEEMRDVFLESLTRARCSGRAAVVRLVAREALDVTRTAISQRRLGLRARGAPDRGRVGSSDARGPRVAVQVWDDVVHATRSIARRPGFALLAAGTVALGVGATTAIYGAIESVLLNPLPYQGSSRLVTLWRGVEGTTVFVTPGAEQIERWSAQVDLFEGVEPTRSRTAVLTGAGPAARLSVSLVGPSFYDFLGLRPVLGRTFTPDETAGDGARVVLLGYHIWRDRFGGDRSVLGRTVVLDGEAHTVIGVMPRNVPMPTAISERRDVWLPLPDRRRLNGGQVLARLREGVTIADVQARFDRIAKQIEAEGGSAASWRGVIKTVAEMFGTRVASTLRVLMVAVTLLLLIACVNVSNLLLGRASSRRQETAVRSALGASRSRIVRQHVMESLMLGLAGGVAGVVLAWLGVSWLTTTAVGADTLDFLAVVRLNGRVVVFAALASIGAVLVFGVMPAFDAARGDAARWLGFGRRVEGGRREGRLRWALIGAEVALSFALLTGALLVVRSLAEMRAREPGFEAAGLLVMRVSLPTWKYAEGAWTGVYDRIVESIDRLPEVRATAQSSGVPPLAGVFIGGVGLDGQAPGDTRMFFGVEADATYFQVAGQRIIDGRAFTEAEVRDAADVVILGEAAARQLFPSGDALGQSFRFGGDENPITVIGIAADVAQQGLSSEPPELQMYRPLSFEGGYILARTGAADPEPTLVAMRRAALEVEPDAAIVELAPVDAMLQATLGRERLATALFGAFAGLAIVLSAVGLYGVVAQLVSQRTREIGIRISLGARAADIRTLVLRNGVIAICTGVACGFGIACGAMGPLTSRLFGVRPAGPGTYLFAAGVLAVTALAACWVPAARAARTDPVRAFRGE